MENDEKDRTRRAFAARFCNALKELGYSVNQQKEMQQLFGVSGQAVGKWAKGETMPTASRMPHVAGVLGVRRAWLQDGEEPMRPVVCGAPEQEGHYGAKQDLEITLSGEELNLLRMYRLLSPKRKKAIRDMVTLFLEGSEKYES